MSDVRHTICTSVKTHGCIFCAHLYFPCRSLAKNQLEILPNGLFPHSKQLTMM